MKKINIIYWISTGLFAALMLFAALPDAMITKEAVDFMTLLGYPRYFIPFIGIMKIIGVVAILVPLPARVKEWAYAGLAFDLFGAIYSIIGAGMANGQMVFMIAWILPGVVSYIYFHKRLKLREATNR